jgi:hypothetical protein
MHVFINCYILNISHVSYQETNTSTISHFVKLYWKTFVSQLLNQLFK